MSSKHLPLRRTTALTKFPPGILHLLTSDSVWNRRNFLSLNDRVGSVMDKVPSAHVPKINSASDSDVLPLSWRSSQLKVSGVKRRRLPRGRSSCDGCDLAAYSCDVTLMNPRYRINKSGIKTRHEVKGTLFRIVKQCPGRSGELRHLIRLRFQMKQTEYQKQELETKSIFITADTQNYQTQHTFVFISLWEFILV